MHHFITPPKIERGIPIPERITIQGFIRSLKVGDSFVLPKAPHTQFYQAANRLGWKLSSRKIDGSGYRVWRVK